MEAEGDGNDDRKATASEQSGDVQVMKTNVKGLFTKIKLDDILYCCICFFSIVALPVATIGAGYHYYEISMNIRPVSESIVDDLNCTELVADLSRDERDASVCSMKTFEARFTLFHRQINYFHFAPNFAVSFCENRPNGYSVLQKTTKIVDYFGAKDIPQDIEELLGGGNIGQCHQAMILTAAVFSAITGGFAALTLLWFTVLSFKFDSTKTIVVHVILAGATMVSSIITITIYLLTIDPLRSSIDTNYCDRQSTFRDCKETTSPGFYCQVATAALSASQILVYALKMVLKRNGGNEIENRQSLEEEPDNIHHHLPFYKNPHFWVKFGRYSEFFLATMSAMMNYATLDILLPDGDRTPISMFSYVWGNQFCNDEFFANDLLLLNDSCKQKMKFGDCKLLFKYKMLLGLAKLVIASGLALFMKRDAAKNPLFYLGGLVADLGSIIAVCMIMVTFLSAIYPGRGGIDPPFCDRYSECVLGVEPGNPENCSISFGPGFVLLCLLLPLIAGNLVVELVAGEIGSKYGAINAFHTVLKRVRKQEYKKAVFHPASFYLSKELVLPREELSIESKENDDDRFLPSEYQDKTSSR
mmetsp:Transcript_5794/g.14467  ORF Transcript_5794/g.14467 Transcript_5794/m.14467 type:complete len:587 (+) Transcript_5794:56-1816(+)|eukprot:CAMPEP_0197194554 /NCGR_PEP_ID=MMETSP1423-20130617/29452_1 /TAXON_ID=476441 /ORGANISM="Pseudo-nitzschia heimii, Strain UNC1101" /LENGTH=586 /DNA_ID=CAMNT_0042647993 /DNA_START=18 /DNA_END=1778 /DNA_ORIENTATION=-